MFEPVLDLTGSWGFKAGIHSRGSNQSKYEPGSVTTNFHWWLSLARTPIGLSHDYEFRP